MDRLTPELVTRVASHLDRRSLASFAFVDQQCRAVSFRARLHTITVVFSTHAELEAAVAQCLERLRRFGAFKAVRHLRVAPSRWHRLDREPELSHMADAGDRPLEPWKYSAADAGTSWSKAQWERLTELVGRLPMLEDLTWASAHHLPPVILPQLQRMNCRLHLHNFQLRPVRWLLESTYRLHPHDLAIATSRSLHSISVRLQDNEQAEQRDDIDDVVLWGATELKAAAVRQMTSGAAPNLRSVYVLRTPSTVVSTPDNMGIHYFSRYARNRGLLQVPTLQQLERTRGALHELDVTDHKVITHWTTFIDVNVLRVLKVHRYLEPHEVQYLSAVLRNGPLEELAVTGGEEFQPDTPLQLILALQPLKILRLSAVYSIDCVMQSATHCGARLQRLYCPEVVLQEEWIRAVGIRCPQLTDLGVGLVRRNEQVLATVGLWMPRLHRVHLTLYTRDGLWGPPRDRTSWPLSTHLERALEDIPVDERLAQWLFATISEAKLDRAPSLERLDICVNATIEASDFANEDCWTTAMRYFGRSLTCTRSQRHGVKHECVVEDYNALDAIERDEAERNGLLLQVREDFLFVMAEIWPESGRKPLQDVWRSLLPTEGSTFE